MHLQVSNQSPWLTSTPMSAKRHGWHTTIKSLLPPFLLFLIIICLAGCGGSASTTDNQVGIGLGNGAATPGYAKLSWVPPANANVAGFKVYYGTTSKAYSNSKDAGMVTSYTVNGLASGTYYFVVTAYDSSGNESPYSNEASKTIP